ncbi:hypothetical protein [Photorhabdus laumondii]|uniref:hypothetical protein n=1 Tax=Photorhabdus laumondii TaxID=2218628 RepID=UPI0025B206C6|nr:hypothetical protein [Photorhabdus laumondii]
MQGGEYIPDVFGGEQSACLSDPPAGIGIAWICVASGRAERCYKRVTWNSKIAHLLECELMLSYREKNVNRIKQNILAAG